jgi:predicted tellurium resistance membrane protein TerC
VILETPEFWGRLLEIGILNMLLSWDNEVVIALAVRALPRRQRLLGQLGGTLGAVVLRLLFVGVISMLLRVPLLRLVGGLLLIWIAYRLVRPVAEAEAGSRHAASFWESVWIIVVNRHHHEPRQRPRGGGRGARRHSAGHPLYCYVGAHRGVGQRAPGRADESLSVDHLGGRRPARLRGG